MSDFFRLPESLERNGSGHFGPVSPETFRRESQSHSKPGAIAPVRMPKRASSLDQVTAIAATPAFVAT
jgi:hypothetical protein